MLRVAFARASAAMFGAARLVVPVFILASFVSVPHAALAAADTKVQGVVRDALQRPLAGVKLRLESPDGKSAGTAITSPEGRFSLTGVAPGLYSLIGEKDGFDTATAILTVPATGAVASDLTLASKQALDLSVTAKQLEEARSSIQPRIGASTYTLSSDAIQNQPGGEDAPLNQVLLQAPGVSQDSFGQIHIRNEHANIQYRIDGVILPEGVSFFGQSLDTRLAASMDLITGALPAQYGLQTAGIVDIQTKSGAFEPGGAVGVYGGSNGWLEPSAEYAGSSGHFNYYIAGDYLQNGIGIQNPTASYNAIHDETRQYHGFAYLEDILDATSKVSALLGTFRGQFQIPNNPGQIPNFIPVIDGHAVTNFNSASLNERQLERNDYAVLAYLKTTQDYDFQASAYTRYSSVSFDPDPVGDLVFNGIAQSATRSSTASGLQFDGSYKLALDHTLRGGALITVERAVSATSSVVLPDLPAPQIPLTIDQSGAKTGWTYSAYLQDEWRVTSALTFNFGARFDTVNAYTNESQLSPRFNAVWKATPTTTLHAGYANYFTPPPLELVSSENIRQFNGTSGAPPSAQNSPVKAERAHYFDIGIDQEILPGLKGGIDAYYKYARNLIDEGQFGAPIILTPFNYHIGQNHGVELTGNYTRGAFAAYGNIAFAEQRGEGISSAQFNFDPAELAYIKNHAIDTDHTQLITASGGLSYLWQGTVFSADVIAGTGLRSGFANISSLPTYEQVNFGVSHKFEHAPGGPITLRVDLINALDQIYEIRSGTGVGVGAPQFGPRRTVFFGMKKEF